MTAIPAPTTTRPGARAGRRAALLPAAILGVAYAVVTPRTGDLAAQVYRSDLVQRNGLAVWDNFWYGGHHLPGYSLMFPLVAALISPAVVGGIAVVGSSALFAHLVRNVPRRNAAVIWFTVGMAANLVAGRLSFAMGVLAGLAAVLSGHRRHLIVAGLLSLVTAATSPVAAAFVALVGCTLIVADPKDRGSWRVGLALALPATAGTLVMQRMFPEGGTFPFDWWWFAQTTIVLVACWRFVPRRERLVRVGLVVYGVACLSAFVIPSPMGTNTMRLGALVLGPVLLATTAPRRIRGVFLAVLAFIVVWQWEAPVYDVSRTIGDPSVGASYYRPLLDTLDRIRGGQPFRLEIPPTASHWEATYVAATVPLARGWERQLDRKVNAVFYDGTLGAASYDRWLVENGVAVVAIPRLPVRDFDPGATAEARLIRRGLPYLSEVWHSPRWRVFSVTGSPALVQGPGSIVRLTADTLTLRATEPGTVLVKIRWSPYSEVVRGVGCATRSREGWTAVDVGAPGILQISWRFELDRALGFSANGCTSAPAPRAARSS